MWGLKLVFFVSILVAYPSILDHNFKLAVILEKGYVFLNNDRQRSEIEVVVASFLATYDQV